MKVILTKNLTFITIPKICRTIKNDVLKFSDFYMYNKKFKIFSMIQTFPQIETLHDI